MGAQDKQTKLEERIVEQVLVHRRPPVDVLRELLSQSDAPDPLEAVFALTTVATEMSSWREAELRKLAEYCFQDATLLICELWAEGYELKKPGTNALDTTSEPVQSRSSTTEPTE